MLQKMFFGLPVVMCAVFVFGSVLLRAQTSGADASEWTFPTIRKSTFRLVKPNRNTVPLFAVPFLPFHTSPQQDLFVSEFIVAEDDPAKPSYITESAWNLRQTNLFRSVQLRLDSAAPSAVHMTTVLEERAQISPELVFEANGGTAEIGAVLDVVNLDGKGINLNAGASYRTENGIGWEGAARMMYRRALDPVGVEVRLRANRLLWTHEFAASFPVSADLPYWSGEILRWRFAIGDEIVYRGANVSAGSDAPARLLQPSPFGFDRKPFVFGEVSGHAAVRGTYWDEQFFVVFSYYTNSTSRTDAARITDNIFMPSLGLRWERLSTARTPEEPQTGVYADVYVGLPVPIGNNQRSRIGSAVYDNNPVLSIRAGGAGFIVPGAWFGAVRAEYGAWTGGYISTIFTAKTSVRLWQGIALAARFSAEGSNVLFGRQFIIDSERGVRGYGANAIALQNIDASAYGIANLELRNLPIGEVGAYTLGGTLFVDVGGIYIASQTIRWNAQFHLASSVGAGLRLHYPPLLAFRSEQSVIRVDIAYLPQLQRFGQITISAREAFSLYDIFQGKQHEIIGQERWKE
jgi:Omp85 superfamily domain